MMPFKLLLIVVAVSLITACSSPERRAYRAKAKSANYESDIAKERLKLVEDYKKCAVNAGEDKAKLEACDSYLKAAEALQ